MDFLSQIESQLIPSLVPTKTLSPRHLAEVCFSHVHPPFLVSLSLSLVSGRSSAYGDTTVEGHPAGPGSVSSSTGAISTTTAQQEGDGSDGDGETEGDIHTSNRSGTTKALTFPIFELLNFLQWWSLETLRLTITSHGKKENL